MSSLTRWVLSHKRIVVVGWIFLTIAGIMAAGPATDALDPEFSVPDKEGWETNVEISKHYLGTGGNTVPLVPVVTLPQGKTVDSPGVRADLARVDRSLEERLPHSRLASYASTGDRAFVSDDGRTTFAVIYPQPDPDSFFGENPRAEKAASAALRDATVGGAPVHLTGFDALMEDSGADNEGPGVLIEALIGGFGALLVLTFVFASFLAVIPIFMAVVSIMTTFLLLLGLTELTSVSPIVQFLIALIGLGVAIDYSLIVASRWREERSHGASGEAAVQRAMETAGRAVIFSGITVAIGLFALIALPLPFLRSMGYARPADPAGLHSGRDHPAAGRAGEVRIAARLAPPAHRRQSEPRVDTLGDGRRAAPLAGSRCGHGGGPGARLRRHRPAAWQLRCQHGREVRRRQGRAGGIGEVRHRRGLDPSPRDPGRGRDRSAEGGRGPAPGRRHPRRRGTHELRLAARRDCARRGDPGARQRIRRRARPRSTPSATRPTRPAPTCASAANRHRMPTSSTPSTAASR